VELREGRDGERVAARVVITSITSVMRRRELEWRLDWR
jgi:hypothetical protein